MPGVAATPENRALAVAFLVLALAVVVTVTAVLTTCGMVERAIPTEPR